MSQSTNVSMAESYRELAMNFIYQYLETKNKSVSEFFDILKEGEKKYSTSTKASAKQLITDFLEYKNEAQEVLKLSYNKPIDSLYSIEKSILLLGVVEISFIKKNSKKIIIDECVKLSKNFGEENTYKVINAVLDNLKKPNND